MKFVHRNTGNQSCLHRIKCEALRCYTSLLECAHDCTRVDCGASEEKIRKQIVIPKIGEIVPLTETSAYISIRRVAESGNGKQLA